MSKLNIDRFNNRCREQLTEFFNQITNAACRTDDEITAAFSSFQMKVLDGVVFHTNAALNNSGLLLSEGIVELLGADTSITEMKELAFRVFADSFRNGDDPTEDQYYTLFLSGLESYLDNTFDFVGPCETFRFTDEITGLRSAYISVITADEFLANSHIATKGGNWVLTTGKEFSSFVENKTFVTTIGGFCWSIKTSCPKDHVRQQARWMAEAFTSLVRLGIMPADYCHRAKLGVAEPTPTESWPLQKSGILFGETTIHHGGFASPPQYLVDKRFAEDFHSKDFQDKLAVIFNPENGSLAKRVFDGLGWLSRGRQSLDMSERLLFFFTAMESLLSGNDQFSPVSDSIARYVSVILAKEPKKRHSIHTDMKNLYGLRSSLVHRGIRSAHLLNANNVQHFTEACYISVIANIDLSTKHSDFLAELKIATHGTEWPSDK